MNDKINQALSYYNINVSNIANLHLHETFKLTDESGNRFFLKLYSGIDDTDIVPGERLYHTYEQIRLEAEILLLLSDSVLKTAAPLKNKYGDFVTTLDANSGDGSIFASITSFVDGVTKKHTEAPTAEMAYIAGIAAARLHLESKNKLLPLALKRPHKRQEYIRKMQDRLSKGIEIGVLSVAQYEMVSQCSDMIINCMNRLDKDMDNNVGLVHTDIQNSNVIYTQSHGTLIDFSRSVYSYYLYDLGEMCLHGNFGGSSPELQKAILRGYHSVKPLTEDHLFAMQVFFVMFILIIMATGIELTQNTWRDNVLIWFSETVHPGLVSGKGYLDSSVLDI